MSGKIEEQLDVESPVYETHHEVGENNVELLGMDLHNPVFFFSSLLIVIFVIGTLIFPESAKLVFDSSKAWSIAHFDWLFMVGGNLFCHILPGINLITSW